MFCPERGDVIALAPVDPGVVDQTPGMVERLRRAMGQMLRRRGYSDGRGKIAHSTSTATTNDISRLQGE
jgi:hypothetical protein